MKKRLSIWLHGGVGTGHFDQGSPLLEQLIEGLTNSFEVIVYSQCAPNPGYRHGKFVIRTASSKRTNSVVRRLTLMYFFLRDHRKERFDILLAFWGWPAGLIVVLLGKIFRIPRAVYLMGGDAAGVPSVNYGILHKPLLRRVAVWAYNRSSLLLGMSAYQRDQLLSFGLRNTVVVIPCGVDADTYKFREKHPGDVVHFIHVGHLNAVKDQSTLVRAFASINRQRPSELWLLGVDCLDGAIQALCDRLGIRDNVRFIGMVPYKKMPLYYQWADIMLHTSLSEGQCMALTEAAACGVLIAGTPVGLLYDLREDCGIVTNFRDHDTLARRILDILEKPEEQYKKIMNARRWSEQHPLSWTIAELTKHLNNL